MDDVDIAVFHCAATRAPAPDGEAFAMPRTPVGYVGSFPALTILFRTDVKKCEFVFLTQAIRHPKKARAEWSFAMLYQSAGFRFVDPRSPGPSSAAAPPAASAQPGTEGSVRRTPLEFTDPRSPGLNGPGGAQVPRNFDIILDHLSGRSALFTAPHTPCTVPYLVTMLIGC